MHQTSLQMTQDKNDGLDSGFLVSGKNHPYMGINYALQKCDDSMGISNDRTRSLDMLPDA